MTHDDIPHPRKPRDDRPWAFCAFLLLALAGCGGSSGTTKSDGTNKADAAKVDPWDAAAKRLRKDTDLGTCRAALNQLNNDLANRPDVPGPAPLAPDAEKALGAVFPLAPIDATEIRPAAFSNLDPAYLADCFYLRDAAKSLEVPGVTPAKAVDLAFAWVCRQVHLNPWLRPVRQNLVEGTVVPPTFVLRRGTGSGLERAFVFLALLQQMGIDGCLVGPAASANEYAVFVAYGENKQPLTGSPRGPFWAVGARVGADIILFDPWRGEKLPGTLAALKTDPAPLKPWTEDKRLYSGVTPAEVKDSRVYLVAPVSGLAPRLALLEEKLKADSGVKLAVNPAALRDSFLNEAVKGPAFPNPEVKFWNPPDDRFCYGRVLAAFLPFDEGGLDRDDPGVRLHTQFRVSLMPREVLVLPRELSEKAVRNRLISIAATVYEKAFFEPPSPRERIQRGKFQEAARYLSEKQTAFTKGRERLRNNADEQAVVAWSKRASEVYADLSRAENFTPSAVPEAQQAVADFWQRQGGMAQLIVDRATAGVGQIESAFLIALCKHEEAERQQARRELPGGERADAKSAWEEAANAWRSYLDDTRNDPAYADRAASVTAMADRAAALAK